MPSVFFDLRLNNYWSGSLKKMGADSKSVFTDVDKSIGRTQRNLNDLGKEVKLKIDSSGLKQAGNDIERLNNRMSNVSTFKIAQGAFWGNMAQQTASNLGRMIWDEGKTIINRGMGAGATKMQFEVLAGKQEGNQLYGDLRKYIRESIFGPELYTNAKMMMAFGIAAREVMPDIKMLGDVAMGDKERMDHLTLAFSQTMSAGKLIGNDLLQYVAAGFNPLAEISKKTGKSMADLRDDMSEGKISAQMVRDAFVQATSAGGKFHGMLDKMALTPFGKSQAQVGNIQDAEMALGATQDKALGALLDKTSILTDKLPQAVERMAPQLEKIITATANGVEWISNNTEKIGTMANLVKIGAEAFIIWKTASLASTAANWLWVNSVKGMAVPAVSVAESIDAETAALLAQTEVIEANALAWTQLTVAERSALTTMASNVLPVNMTGVAAGANAAGMGMMTGALAGIGRAVVPVAVMYFAGEALNQFFPKTSTNQSTSWEDIFTMWGRAKLADAFLGAHTRMAPSGQLSHGSIFQKDKLAQMLPGLTGLMGNYFNQPNTSAGNGTMDISDAIVGGGHKQTNINVHNLVENLINNPNSKGEAIEYNVHDLKVILAKILTGVPG